MEALDGGLSVPAHDGEPFRIITGFVMDFVVFIGKDGLSIDHVAVKMHPGMFLVFPVMVVMAQVVIVDGALVAGVLYIPTCSHRKISCGRHGAVVIMDFISCLDSKISFCHQAAVIGFYFIFTLL